METKSDGETLKVENNNIPGVMKWKNILEIP